MEYQYAKLKDKIRVCDEFFCFVENSLSGGIWYFDLDNPDDEFASFSLCRFLGYSCDSELLPFSIRNMVFPEDLQKLCQAVEELNPNSDKKYFSEILRFKHREGNTIHVKSSGMVLKNRTGHHRSLLVAISDFSEAVQNALKIDELKFLLDTAQDLAKIGTWELDPETGKTKWTDEVYRIHDLEKGFDHDVLNGVEFFEGDDRIKIRNAVESAVKELKSYDLICKFKSAKGVNKIVRTLGKPIVVCGKLQKVIGVIQDVTESYTKQLETENLKNSLQKTNEIAQIGFWDIDVINSVHTWSDGLKSVFEVADDFEPNMESAISFFKEGFSRESISKALVNAVVTGEGYELKVQIVTPGGKTKWVRVIAETKMQAGKCVKIFGVIQDIQKQTEYEEIIKSQNEEHVASAEELTASVEVLKRTQDKLIENEKHSRSLLETQTNYVIRTDLEGKYTYANPKFIEDFGHVHGIENILGINCMESMIEEDRGKVIELIEGLIQNPEKSVQIDIRKIGPDKTIRATLWEFACLRDKKGIPCEIQCVGIDYTERKKAEDERDKLLEITKKQNEILKNFAQIISHNFRSYAANIYGLIDILSDEKPELRENEFFVSLRESSDKLNTAIDDVSLLLRMQAQGELNLEQIHLKSALQEVFASLSALFSEKDVIYTDCLSGQERVIAEHSYLKSILTNILTNAVKYSSPERESFLRITSLEDKQFVRVDFEGNGLGIDLEKYGDKLFGLYKTFHDNQDAHGLGLHMTKNQIEQLGGKIEVRSKVGEGTCFSVYLKKAFT